jgi:hypothetical protein
VKVGDRVRYKKAWIQRHCPPAKVTRERIRQKRGTVVELHNDLIDIEWDDGFYLTYSTNVIEALSPLEALSDCASEVD